MALLEGAPMLVAQSRRRYARSSPHPSAKTISAPPLEPRWRATAVVSVLQRYPAYAKPRLKDRIQKLPVAGSRKRGSEQCPLMNSDGCPWAARA